VQKDWGFTFELPVNVLLDNPKFNPPGIVGFNPFLEVVNVLSQLQVHLALVLILRLTLLCNYFLICLSDESDQEIKHDNGHDVSLADPDNPRQDFHVIANSFIVLALPKRIVWSCEVSN